MATPTYDLIASQVLSTSAASVSFSSLPATYRDLVLVVEILGSGGNVGCAVRFNSDATSGAYKFVYMNGNGSTTASGVDASNQTAITGQSGTTTNAGQTLFQIMDYSVTDKHKSVLARMNRSDSVAEARANRWANTSAISQIDVLTVTNSYAAGSTFYLYGIAS